MTVGMSAPPIGMISSTPKVSASAMMTPKASGAHAAVGLSTTPTPSAAASSRRPTLVTFCSG